MALAVPGTALGNTNRPATLFWERKEKPNYRSRQPGRLGTSPKADGFASPPFDGFALSGRGSPPSAKLRKYAQEFYYGEKCSISQAMDMEHAT